MFRPQLFLQSLSNPIHNPTNLLVLKRFFLVLEDEMNSEVRFQFSSFLII
jgi:hypothetical protein